MPEFTQLPSFEKLTFIEDLTIGGDVHDVFLLGAAQQHQAKNGPYWRLEFRDKTGSIGGKVWSPHSLNYPELRAGSLVCVTAKVGSYKDIPELNIESLYILTSQDAAALNLGDFMQASAHNPEDMFAQLQALCNKEMQHKPWKKFTTLLLNDAAIAAALKQAPAAKAMHHAYVGGLLEHTLSVCSLSMRLADHYPQLDRQVLLAGALCHDIGKIWELTQGLSVDYTQEGRLLGHIILAIEKLQPFLAKSGLEAGLVEHLQHLILSHHGTLEFGSPKVPATAEAIILHYADNIDAKLQQVHNALVGVEPNGWSAYNSPLERFLFNAEATPAAAKVAAGKEKAATKTEKNVAKNAEASVHSLPLISQCSLLLKE